MAKPPDANTATVVLDTDRTIGEISSLLFGGFAEHLGRCIYGGIYDPVSAHADEDGLRQDVLDALRELNFSILRYPGGNFVSGYNWLDGVGPKQARPRRREMAWRSIESNQFGTNEFIGLCRKLGALPMLGLNFGTGTIADAANLVEYCNSPPGTAMADLRVAHGFREPHAVKYWCLGNEMDAPWQIGQLTAEQYGQKASQAAKLIKCLDSTIKLISCGSSNPDMPSYPEWDRITLETCWDQVDYHSMHYYADNFQNDTASYLASSIAMEQFVDVLSATLRYVKARLRSRHEVYLAWDEWNVWYKDKTTDGQWSQAPHLAEEVYNLEDALVVAQFLSVFLRKCDVVKIACLAQIVNAISPILTSGDRLLKQPTFYPFMLFRKYASGISLDPAVYCPHYSTRQYGDVPVLNVSATYDPTAQRMAAFLVNRSQSDVLTARLVWPNIQPRQVEAVWQLTGPNAKAVNTFDHDSTISPRAIMGVRVADGAVTLRLPPLSFTTLAAVC